ncbi:MFS transporter [Sorangium sp. So ce1000]|uniref:MFS transporter n=1 Tax=Sorangium sp. So ce1000 TaxID=3133325 RepID=UPI003F5F016B
MTANSLEMEAPAVPASDAPPRPWAVLGLTSIAVFVMSLDTTILYVAFEDLRRTFLGVSDAELSWVLNAYTIIVGAFLILAGRVADRVGRKRTFLGGLVVFIIGSALSGIAPNPALLIAARVIQALGGAALLPASLALILAAFPKEKQPIAVSIWAAIQAGASAFGPAMGAAIVQSVGWRWTFYVNVPIGLYAVLRSRSRLAESRESDVGAMPGAWPILLAIAAPGLFALGIIGAGAWGPTSAASLGCLGVSLALLALLVVDSRRGRVPMIDPVLFRDRNFRLASWATFLFTIAFTAMFFGLILFLTRVWGYSTLRAGLAMTPGPMSVMPFAILGGKIAAKRGHRGVLSIGGAAYAVAGLVFLLSFSQTPDYLRLFLPVAFLIGFALGFVLPSLQGVAVHGLSSNRLALGVAVNSALRQVGSVLGVAFVVGVATQPRLGALVGFRALAILMIVGGVVTALIGLGVDTRPASSRAGE